MPFDLYILCKIDYYVSCLYCNYYSFTWIYWIYYDSILMLYYRLEWPALNTSFVSNYGRVQLSTPQLLSASALPCGGFECLCRCGSMSTNPLSKRQTVSVSAVLSRELNACEQFHWNRLFLSDQEEMSSLILFRHRCSH